MSELSPDLVLATCVENNGPMLLAIGWALLVAAIVTLSLRILFRHRYGNGLHADDYTMLASMTSGITAVILLTLFVNAGFGRHIYCLSPPSLPLVFKYSVLAQIFNIAGIGLVKISVCLHILRIVDRTRRYLSHFLRLLILITFLSHLAQVLLFCVQCRPMPAIWSPQEYPHAKCFSAHITYLAGYIGFGLDAFTDLVTAIIPIVVIKPLQMNARTKAALCILMGLGVLTAVCAVAKAITLQGVFAEDYTWALWRPGLCTIIEHLIGMTIASAPALNPLFKRALRTPTSLYNSSSSHHNSSNSKRRRMGRSSNANRANIIDKLEREREKDAKQRERQSRRVTRWADAWTPPNVRVAHYRSPYASASTAASEWEYHDRGASDDHDSWYNNHSSSGGGGGGSGNGSGKHEKSTPVTESRSTDDSEATTAIDSDNRTAKGGSLAASGERHGEITKMVSFRRESEHGSHGSEGDVGVGVGVGVGGIDRLGDEHVARGRDGELMADRLWIGNGYWGLPPAPPSPGVLDAGGGRVGVGVGVGGGRPLLLLPPHPAVGRWVLSGAERPVPRPEPADGLLPSLRGVDPERLAGGRWVRGGERMRARSASR